jgi:hypothetical protein
MVDHRGCREYLAFDDESCRAEAEPPGFGIISMKNLWAEKVFRLEWLALFPMLPLRKGGCAL